MSLLARRTCFAGVPMLDLPKFRRMCILNPALSIKTQFLFQSMFSSPFHSTTFSLCFSKVSSDVLEEITGSNFFSEREALT